MSILLTGGAGYIASHTLVELIQAGHDVISVDNYVNSSPEALRRVEEITGKKVKTYEANVQDVCAMNRIFDENTIDAVIHFAGLKAVGESVGKPLAYYRNNLDCTLTLLEVMGAHHVKRLIFSSSATVYGKPDAMPLVETMVPMGCSNPYGWTKYMIERILTDLYTSDSDWSIMLLRYFNPIGAHQSGLIGDNPNGIPNNLLPYVSRVAIGMLAELPLYGTDYDTKDGTCIRDYIHIVDLAKGHVSACAYALEHKGCEVINLGTGVGYSVFDIINAFKETNHVDVPYSIAPRRAGDIPVSFSNADKAARLLGWRAEKTLTDMCRDTWNFQQKNPNGY